MISALYSLTFTLCSIAICEGVTDAVFKNTRPKGLVLFVFSLTALLCVSEALLSFPDEVPNDFSLSGEVPAAREGETSKALEDAIGKILTERFGLENDVKVSVSVKDNEIGKIEIEIYSFSDFFKIDGIRSFMKENFPCDTEVRGVG